MKGLTCCGTLTCAPASETLVSPSVTCAPKFGSIRHAAPNFGRDVMVTLPLISALALRFLILMLPTCLAALAPSRPPIASCTAPVAFDDSEPVILTLPVMGVDSDSISWPPVAVIGPRDAVQPISAFCKTCAAGLSAFPAKFFCALRSAASRIALSEITTGAITKEVRATGGSGGGSVITGALTAPGDSRFIASRLTRNETTTTPSAMAIVLSLPSRRIIPPGQTDRRVYRAAERRTRPPGSCNPKGKSTSENGPGVAAGAVLLTCREFNDYRVTLPRSARRLSIGSTITLAPTLTRE